MLYCPTETHQQKPEKWTLNLLGGKREFTSSVSRLQTDSAITTKKTNAQIYCTEVMTGSQYFGLRHLFNLISTPLTTDLAIQWRRSNTSFYCERFLRTYLLEPLWFIHLDKISLVFWTTKLFPFQLLWQSELPIDDDPPPKNRGPRALLLGRMRE